MKLADIVRLALGNLRRRPGRTLLTVSGVVIGCCAVVIMISLGIGMQQSQDQMLASMGNLRQITVSPAPAGTQNRTPLNKAAASGFKRIDDVEQVVPKKTLELSDLRLVAGEGNRYVCDWATVVGIPEDALAQAGYTLRDGELPGGSGKVLAGGNLAFHFADSKRPEGRNTVDYWADEKAKPFFDLRKEGVTLSKPQERDASGDDAEQTYQAAVSYQALQSFAVAGIMEPNYDLGEETDGGIVLTMGDFDRLAKLVQRAGGGAPSKEFTQVIVTVKTLADVAPAEAQIRAQGFQTYSMESIRKPMEQSVRQKQLMLAGLGAVSLFVAAIGIANTMIMAITERTREIGIMKALGCDLADIQREFLIEAALIGLAGGVAGSLVSCAVSALMNLLSGGGGSLLGDGMYADEGAAAGASLSVIPPWLVAFAIVFSVAMGVGAGYIPSNRAAKISVLEAMKN